MIKIKQYNSDYQSEVYQFVWDIMINDVKKKPSKLKEELKKLENIERYYLTMNNNFWIAIDENANKLIGTVAVEEINEKIFHLQRFYIDKTYRHQGIGTLLYCELEEHVKRKKGKMILLSAGQQLKSAQSFYIKSGYKILENDGINSIKFRKEI